MEGDEKSTPPNIEYSGQTSTPPRRECDELLGQSADIGAVLIVQQQNKTQVPTVGRPKSPSPPCCLLQVRAQVMRRDDSSGGWLPMEGGGLSQIALHESTTTAQPGSGLSPSGQRSYLITGHRIADNMPILECRVEGGGMQYIRANPTFHHWRTADNRRFGLTFQSPHQANAFDTGLQTAIRSIADPTPLPLAHPPALRLTTCAITSSSLASIVRTTYSPSDVGILPLPNQVPSLGTGGESLHLNSPHQVPCGNDLKREEAIMGGGARNVLPYYVSPRHHRRYLGSLRHPSRTPQPSPLTPQGFTTTSHISPLPTIISEELKPRRPEPVPSTPPSTNGGFKRSPPSTLIPTPDLGPYDDSYKRRPSLPKYYDTGGGEASKIAQALNHSPTRTTAWWPNANPTPTRVKTAGVHCKYWGPPPEHAYAPSCKQHKREANTSNNGNNKHKRTGRGGHNIVPTKALNNKSTQQPRRTAGNTTAYHSALGLNPGSGLPPSRFATLARTITCLRCASCFIFTLTDEEWEDPCFCPPLSHAQPRHNAQTRGCSSSSHNSDDTSSLGSVVLDTPEQGAASFSSHTQSTFVRWSLLGLLSILLPCLCLYPFFKCCHRLGAWCGLCPTPDHALSTPLPSRRHELGPSRPSSVSTSTTITIQP